METIRKCIYAICIAVLAAWTAMNVFIYGLNYVLHEYNEPEQTLIIQQ